MQGLHRGKSIGFAIAVLLMSAFTLFIEKASEPSRIAHAAQVNSYSTFATVSYDAGSCGADDTAGVVASPGIKKILKVSNTEIYVAGCFTNFAGVAAADYVAKWNGTAWVNNTLAEAGIQPAGSYQPSGTYNTIIGIDTDYALTGANVFSGLTLTDGVIQVVTTRALTAGDIGAATSGHNHTLDSLSNTTITSNTAGEILKWNGSAWINNTLAEAGIATESYVTTAISNLVNGADAAYDTLKEIQDAMATDAELSAAISAITIGNGTVTVNTGSGLTGSGSFTMNQTGATTVTLSHADTSSVANVSSNNSGGVFIQDVALTFDAYGHTTGASVATATMTNFHSGVTDINSTVASNNASGSVNITFTDLVGAVHYNVYLNRILLRPSEVTNVNTSTGQVTIATGVLATDDELEVTGLKIA